MRTKKENREYMREYFKTNDRYCLLNRLGKIRSRCLNPKDRTFHNYGGRGIELCEEWKNNPDSFVAWAIKAGFRRELQIDRINNQGPYSPDNCRWTTSQENNRNRSDNKLDVQKVAEIRRLLSEGQSGPKIAVQFGVHHSLIYRIKLKKQWL